MVWRKRRRDIAAAGQKLAATEERIRDLAARRRRLEADIALYALQQRRKQA